MDGIDGGPPVRAGRRAGDHRVEGSGVDAGPGGKVCVAPSPRFICTMGQCAFSPSGPSVSPLREMLRFSAPLFHPEGLLIKGLMMKVVLMN